MTFVDTSIEALEALVARLYREAPHLVREITHVLQERMADQSHLKRSKFYQVILSLLLHGATQGLQISTEPPRMASTPDPVTESKQPPTLGPTQDDSY